MNTVVYEQIDGACHWKLVLKDGRVFEGTEESVLIAQETVASLERAAELNAMLTRLEVRFGPRR